MKKLLLTSAITLFTVTPIFADIVIPAMTCNVDDLGSGAINGSASLEATYTPNTINTHWYSDGTQINGPTTCTYDTGLQPPTPQPRPGYTFGGWRMVGPQCTIPPVLALTKTNSYGYINANGQAYNNTYGLTENNTWAVSWNNGAVVYGTSQCATNNTGNEPNNTNGYYCWCGVTGYQPSGGSKCDLGNTSWLNDTKLINTITTEIDEEGYSCGDACARACVTKAPKYGAWRKLFALPTCTIPSALFATNPTEYAWFDNDGQGYNVNNIFNLNEFGLWAAKWANNAAVAGIAQCMRNSDAESVIGVASGTLGGLPCEDGVGYCSCMCGLFAYGQSGGNACVMISPVWMNDIPAIENINIDIEVSWGECNINQCVRACAGSAFNYDGWKNTYGL